MTEDDMSQRLGFLRGAEQLKDTVCKALTTNGRTESVADHTWRLCLLVMTFADQLAELCLMKLLKICVIHDLGEASMRRQPRARARSDEAKISTRARRLCTAHQAAAAPARIPLVMG